MTVAILYGLLSFLLFSETLIVQLIEAQKEYYLNESKNFEQFDFSIKDWESLQDKKEFQRDGHYYDVKKISIDKNKVTVTVLKDEFENLLNYIAKNIFPKNKKSKTSKIKLKLEIYLPKITSSTSKNQLTPIEHNYYYSSKVLIPHASCVFRPPCMS
nr:hypothetical protein [uncultured Flavobacterium sp.]